MGILGNKRARQIFHEVLSEIGNKGYHPDEYQEDAHQIIEDFRENHYHDTENKGNYSSNQT
jgi:hypothetical protein